MTVIKIPKPPPGAMNNNRPISSLLRAQIRHMQEAEFRLPIAAQTDVYVNAIKTEGEAADYIKQVTATIHEQHGIRPGSEAKRVAQRPVRPSPSKKSLKRQKKS